MNSVHPSLLEHGAAERTALIRQLNDRLRQVGEGGTTLLTAGIVALPPAIGDRVLAEVANYDNFNTVNDPFEEHDFGVLRVDGTLICFKVDAYDRLLNRDSPDPANTAITRRVLTIMLAEEF